MVSVLGNSCSFTHPADTEQHEHQRRCVSGHSPFSSVLGLHQLWREISRYLGNKLSSLFISYLLTLFVCYLVMVGGFIRAFSLKKAAGNDENESGETEQ